MSGSYTSGPQGAAVPLTRDQKLERAVAEIRELHNDHQDRCGFCHHCGLSWPCPTIAVLDKWGC